MKQDSTIVRLDSIDAYNKLYGLETKHPLVTVIDLTEATKVVNHVRMDYDVYALFLKNGTNCTLKYGRQPYDYQEGTVVSFSPGQLIGVDTDIDEIAPDVIGLIFTRICFIRLHSHLKSRITTSLTTHSVRLFICRQMKDGYSPSALSV